MWGKSSKAFPKQDKILPSWLNWSWIKLWSPMRVLGNLPWSRPWIRKERHSFNIIKFGFFPYYIKKRVFQSEKQQNSIFRLIRQRVIAIKTAKLMLRIFTKILIKLHRRIRYNKWRIGLLQTIQLTTLHECFIRRKISILLTNNRIFHAT